LPFYLHAGIRQGHTHRGQLLGAAPGFGGGAAMLAVERHHDWGRFRVRGAREIQMDNARRFPTRAVFPDGVDVVYALGGEMTLFRGDLEITGGLTALRNFNRYNSFDATNVQAFLGLKATP